MVEKISDLFCERNGGRWEVISSEIRAMRASTNRARKIGRPRGGERWKAVASASRCEVGVRSRDSVVACVRCCLQERAELHRATDYSSEASELEEWTAAGAKSVTLRSRLMLTLRRNHANLLRILPVLVDVTEISVLLTKRKRPLRESNPRPSPY